jgi:ABC-type spermidine/putrescine transport system permease subunit II
MTRRHGGALVKVMAVVSVVVSLPLAVASVVFWRTLTEDVGIPWPVLLIPFVAPVVVVGIGASVVGAVRRMEP